MWGSESTRLRKAMLSSLLAVGLAATGGVGAASAAPADSVTVQPPPGRAFERVSPADKPSGAMAGLNTELMAMPGRSADVGERLIYGATAPPERKRKRRPQPADLRRTHRHWVAILNPDSFHGPRQLLDGADSERGPSGLDEP